VCMILMQLLCPPEILILESKSQDCDCGCHLCCRIIVLFPLDECIFHQDIFIIESLEYCVKHLVGVLQSTNNQWIRENPSVNNLAYLCIKNWRAMIASICRSQLSSMYFLRSLHLDFSWSSWSWHRLTGPPEISKY